MHSHGTFTERAQLTDAQDALLDLVTPHERTENVPLRMADARTLAETITAARDVPHYSRAAMDGYAVRAADTFGASSRAPEFLTQTTGGVEPGTAVRVHTGSELPEGADAVVMQEAVEETSQDLEVFDAVAEGENVAPVGEDVTAGQTLFEPGHRLRPSDLGLLRSVGRSGVEAKAPPTVGVIPTGDELVDQAPEPGEIIETNGLTVSQLVERWGGNARYRNIVPDEYEAVRTAIERDLTKDLIVTTGGSSVGERDLIPDVVSDLGEVVVHGVAIKPGHPVGIGRVRETPVVMAPGYPVSCIIAAVQLVRPALKHAGGMPDPGFPQIDAELESKVASEPGVRSFVRVQLTEEDGVQMAEPVRASGAGVLSSVALADGWLVIPESVEGYAAGTTVTVEDWEWVA